jgi:hypothetical protein
MPSTRLLPVSAFLMLPDRRVVTTMKIDLRQVSAMRPTDMAGVNPWGAKTQAHTDILLTPLPQWITIDMAPGEFEAAWQAALG